MTDKPEHITEIDISIIAYITAQHPLVGALAFWLWNEPIYDSYYRNMPAYELAIRCPEDAPNFVNIIRNMADPEKDCGSDEIFLFAAYDLQQELETWQQPQSPKPDSINHGSSIS